MSTPPNFQNKSNEEYIILHKQAQIFDKNHLDTPNREQSKVLENVSVIGFKKERV